MIKDIEPLVKIPDYSLYITTIIVILISLILFFIVKNLKLKKQTIYDITLKKYQNIDFKNSKDAAYKVSKYSYILAKNQKSKEIQSQLLKELTKYKFKKNVPLFDSETIALYNLFLEVVTNE